MDKNQTALRIKSEFNDLKRTTKAVSIETNFELKKIEKILSGKFDERTLYDFLNIFSKKYPVDVSDLIIEKKDTNYGILFYKNHVSKKNSRVFQRINSKKKFSDYYEYRDTAKSHLTFFYPEWISQLREVKNSDPKNPDVVYNNGHFLHQLNLFVGPVNFYYEINEKKYCKKMNTGDSSYISPFIKHSFTSRDKNRQAYIVAVTTGSNLKRNQKEIRKFGKKFLENSFLKARNTKDFFIKIIKRSLADELISEEKFSILIGKNLFKKIFFSQSIEDLTIKDLLKISNVLKIPVNDLIIENDNNDYVTNKFFESSDFSFFPSNTNQRYKIFRLAYSQKYKKLKGFIFHILTTKTKTDLSFSGNSYLINFGNHSVDFLWKYNKKNYQKILSPGDSVYIEPYISFGFRKKNNDCMIYLVNCETCIDSKTLREMAVISEPLRFINDSHQWFKGKKNE